MRSGIDITEAVFLLLLWKWINVSSIAMFSRRALGVFWRAKKGVMYDLLKREDVNWRELNTQTAKAVYQEVAEDLNARLDLMLVRKLGTPGQEELAMGAIASGGIRVLNENVVSLLRISDEAIEEVAAKEERELERREQAYRGDRPRPEIARNCVVLVDDGVATGATMRAAIVAVIAMSWSN